MLLQPIFGWASDKIGRKSMLLFAFGSAALFTWPIMSALATTHSAQRAFILIMLSLLSLSAYTSISAVVKAGLFPPMVRTLGVALPYALANATFGGTAEYIGCVFRARKAIDSRQAGPWFRWSTAREAGRVGLSINDVHSSMSGFV
jgi:MHS family alpha-ketoglutarate permease-like MFS transporter